MAAERSVQSLLSSLLVSCSRVACARRPRPLQCAHMKHVQCLCAVVPCALARRARTGAVAHGSETRRTPVRTTAV